MKRIVVIDGQVPGEHVYERYTNKRDAVAQARRDFAHVHREEREIGRGWVYFLCRWPTCL